MEEPQSTIPVYHAATQAIVSPRTFFTFDNLSQARAPALVFATVSAGSALGQALYEAFAVGAFTFGGMLVAVVGQFLIAFPMVYLVAGLHHLVARIVLPGRVDYTLSLAVVGYASTPSVFAWTLWMQVATGAWSLVLIGLGFARLRNISVLRGTLAPLFAVVVPLATILGVRTFVIEAFRVPSQGMYPTVVLDDHVFMNKSDFVLGQQVPKYGDIIVFDVPDSESASSPQQYARRVVALPGDSVEIRQNDLFINGKKAPRCVIGTDQLEAIEHTISIEHLGNRAFFVAHDPTIPPEDWGPFSVPLNQVFVLGDNRQASYDSRTWNNGAGGGVDVARIRGRALMIWLPLARMGNLIEVSPRLLPPDLWGPLNRCLEQGPTSTTSL